MLADCVTLWVGDSLTAVERACLRSVMRNGHALALYCYDQVDGVPQGVELRDAREILPREHIFLQRNGSVAAFSDWFRYELLRRELGIWIDTDIYLLKPLKSDGDYLFGEEERGVINNAILQLPPRSPILERLLAVFEQRRTPPWLPWRSWAPVRMGEMLNGGVDLSRLPWGATGPMAMTALCKELGLASRAQPAEVFSPVPWSRADWILDPRLGPAEVTTPMTRAVHLWNYCIAPYKAATAPAGSFLERLQREGAAA